MHKQHNLHVAVLQVHLGGLAVVPRGRGKGDRSHAQEGNGQCQHKRGGGGSHDDTK